MTESNRRIDFVHRSLDAVWDMYERPEYKDRIDTMRALGYHTNVLDAVLSADTYIALDGSSKKTHNITNSGIDRSIGVLAMRPGETTSVHSTSHYLQYSDVETTSKDMVPIGAYTGAVVITSAQLHQEPTLSVAQYGRPTLFLRYDDKHSSAFAGATIHEMTHVAQNLDKSLFVTTDFEKSELLRRVNQELDAYDVQASVYENDFSITDGEQLMANLWQDYKRYHLKNRSATAEDLPDILKNPFMAKALGLEIAS